MRRHTTSLRRVFAGATRLLVHNGIEKGVRYSSSLPEEGSATAPAFSASPPSASSFTGVVGESTSKSPTLSLSEIKLAAELQANQQELEKAKMEINKNRQHFEETLAQLVTQNLKLVNDLTARQEEVSGLTTKNKALISAAETALQAFMEISTDNANLEAQLAQQTEEVNKLKGESLKLNAERTDLTLKCSRQREELQELSGENAILKSEKQQLTKSLQSKRWLSFAAVFGWGGFFLYFVSNTNTKYKLGIARKQLVDLQVAYTRSMEKITDSYDKLELKLKEKSSSLRHENNDESEESDGKAPSSAYSAKVLGEWNASMEGIKKVDYMVCYDVY